MPARDEPDLDPVLSDAVRRAYVRPVDEGTASRHVSAIIAAADAGAQPRARRPRRSRRLWRPALGVGAAVALLLPVGLAAAGVSLPAAVERPYGVIGITLPNQHADAPPAVTTPRSPAPSAPAATTTTARPQEPKRSGGAGSKSSSSKPGGRPGGSGSAGQPSTSRRPGTPPPAGPTGSGKGNGNGNGKPAGNGSGNGGNGSGTKSLPVPRRPVAAPKKPAATKPTVKPAKPAKPQTRPNPSPRRDDPSSAAPQNGNAQRNGSPKKDAGA